MRCREAQKLVSLRIDGVLSTSRSAALEAHLEACAECRTAAEQLEAAWRALDRLEGAVAPPEDWARIEAAAEAETRRWWRFWPRWQFAPTATTLGVLALTIALGTTGGVLFSRLTLAPRRAEPIESRMFAETMGDLPWGSPATGLASVLDRGLSQEKKP